MIAKSFIGQLRSQVVLTPRQIHFTLAILFFCSGVSALIYQVIWERMLFMVFGIDLLSVTSIVSVFMFGLGIGGLAGGYLADRFPTKLLTAYIIIEFGIAMFGFCSPFLIDCLANTFVSSNQFVTTTASFAVLAVPTLLMGATFPMLVTHVNQYDKNIGSVVGRLYFANTLGGALGAYLAGFVLLSVMDIAAVIDRAALLNLLIAFTALSLFRGRPR